MTEDWQPAETAPIGVEIYAKCEGEWSDALSLWTAKDWVNRGAPAWVRDRAALQPMKEPTHWRPKNDGDLGRDNRVGELIS